MCPAAIRTATSQGGHRSATSSECSPNTDARALGGGEVVLELEVDASGTVASVIPLRTTPPYDDVLAKAVTA
jgi:outer membrane biosynthesis protein TonB